MRALDEEESEEDKPSKFASEVSVLKQAAQFLKRQFPRGSASVGANQGLRLTWRLPKGEVRLIVDGAKASKTYLYVELAAADSFVEYAISGEKLAHAIWQALG